MEYVWAFVVGGAICVVGQLLIDYTKLTPARILVLFVTLGVVLGGLGLYEPLVHSSPDGIWLQYGKGNPGSNPGKRIPGDIYRRTDGGRSGNCRRSILWLSRCDIFKTRR